MKILLAGPGTGKTSNIKTIVGEEADSSKFLVISFTNATVKDLKKSLGPIGVNEGSCMTLHKFAVKYNHDRNRHVLEIKERNELEQISKRSGVSFVDLCNFLLATTFDQMIERFIGFAKANNQYLKEKLSQYSILIVDEYQDFNPLEQELIDLLIEVMQETYILGDDDQCIYDFKDASTDRIISLHSDGSNEKVQHEHKCYRCPDIVVEKATMLIKNNSKRVDKKWEKTGKPGSMIIKQFSTNSDCSEYMKLEIEKILKNSDKEKVLVLCPVRFLIEPLLEQLNDSKIDYKNYYVAKVPEELIMSSWILKVLFGKFKYLNLVLLGYSVLSDRSKFYKMIKKHYDEGQDYDALFKLLSHKLPDIIKNNSLNIEDILQMGDFTDLNKLYNQTEGETVEDKLENLFTLMDDDIENRVNVMSIHKSKGLGADHVFIMGLVEGILPNKSRGNDSIESQRRLFYVGMTRAEKSLHLLSTINIEGKNVHTVNKEDFKFIYKEKIWKGKSSRFIQELN